MLRTESFGVNSKKVFAIRDELGGEFLGWGEREERAARRKLHASGAKKKKKKKKREFFRTLEKKEKGFFFFFFSAPGAALSSRTAQHAFSTFPRKASLEEFVGIGNGRFFSSVE